MTPVSAAPERMRPFQHLYLLPAGREASESTRNEARVVLKHLEPRLCGMMIEMLYVPLGRSGSGDETYLIYEQPEEFERAMAWALRLDCAPDSADAGSSWCAAMRSFAELLLQGAVVDRVLQDRCERQLTAVLESQGAASDERWAAGIFGGRLVADYRYDYIGARRLYAQARQLAKDESIEAMTADWWRADTFVQEGRSREAGEAYEDLLDGYTHLWPRSQIIARAYANMKKGKKR